VLPVETGIACRSTPAPQPNFLKKPPVVTKRVLSPADPGEMDFALAHKLHDGKVE
jgi:hypothetical protein